MAANSSKDQATKALIAQSRVGIEFWGDQDNMLYFGTMQRLLSAFRDSKQFAIYDMQQGFL